LYGVILLLAGCAYLVLQREILVQEGPDSILAEAVGKDWKGKVSLLLYALGIGLAFLRPWLAGAVYVAAALLWLVPDRRIERKVAHAPT
jgi:TMEM175 potassium channel family protein